MKKVLVTGGTVFVSRYFAEYYVKKGYDVYVLNRNTRPQPAGVTLIEADRHVLGNKLRGHHFDVVIDTAYNAADVSDLLAALDSFDDYVLISSSAVYPETAPQPFSENTPLAVNKFWGKYGTDKIAAENILQEKVPHAYILRPPYLYGPLNNVYREAFVFDCAMQNRKFYLPQDGDMPLQFFHIDDLCRFTDIILEQKPQQHIFNVGNPDTVTVREWAELCYEAVGCTPTFVNVYEDIEQRQYFSFYNYAYALDVTAQSALMPRVTPLAEGLRESFLWYRDHPTAVNKKPLFDFIDNNLQ